MDAMPPMLPMNYPVSGMATSHGKHNNNNTATMLSGDDDLTESSLFVIAMALLFFVVIITVLFLVQWAAGYCDEDMEEGDETLRLLEDAQMRFRSLNYNGDGDDDDSDSDYNSYVRFPRYGSITRPSMDNDAMRRPASKPISIGGIGHWMLRREPIILEHSASSPPCGCCMWRWQR